jgi:hypothetical protein
MSDFEALHQQGAQQYGMDWLWVNNEIVQTAERYGLDPSAEPQRTVLTAIALAWCRDVAQQRVHQDDD